MELFLEVVQLYEEFDARVSITDIPQIFKDGITMYFTKVRGYLEEIESAPPPRITTVPEQLQERIEHLRSDKRQKVARFIITDQGAGRIGAKYKEEGGVDFPGKTAVINKIVKFAHKRGADSENEEIMPITKKPRKEREGGINAPVCFLCEKRAPES